MSGQRLEQIPQVPRQVRPGGLLACALLGCLAAAVCGSMPLANWADNITLPGIGDAADAWQAAFHRLGLDWPYRTLRHAVRDAEAAQFPGRR